MDSRKHHEIVQVNNIHTLSINAHTTFRATYHHPLGQSYFRQAEAITADIEG